MGAEAFVRPAEAKRGVRQPTPIRGRKQERKGITFLGNGTLRTRLEPIEDRTLQQPLWR